MGGGHAHHQHHHHGGGSDRNRGRLALVLVLSAAYMVAELVGGLVTGSLALLADSGHMLSDVGALGLSLFALWMTRRPPTAQRTWGYYRTEILAALVNGATLVAISIYVFLEAWERFRNPPEVDAPVMMAIAAGGLAVNLIGLRVLSGGRSESLNIRGAWLHVLTDALGSVQAIIAGALIWRLGWDWADPAASVLIGALVIYSSWSLLREAVRVLMESAPAHIDVDEVRNAMAGVSGVLAVHDLHVWTITSGMESLSAHLVVAEGCSGRDLLTEVRATLHDRFGIDHITVQLEPEEFAPCQERV
ncbi:MAG TPA: cation diffusion facilitator family transporter [Thermoanaerobaculia bacterium]|nr:cation diffusion facilitator family transporter [Thermoanaerobaculia bacterium]